MGMAHGRMEVLEKDNLRYATTKREDRLTARYNVTRPEFPLICRDVRLGLHRIVVRANLKSVCDDRVVRDCNRLKINAL